MFKKMFISQMLKIKIEKRMKGEIVFRINSLKKADDEYSKYEKFLQQALNKLKGIRKIIVDTQEGLVDVVYDEKVLSEELLLKWVDILKEVGIENYDFIEKTWEENEELVIKTLDKQLDKEMKKIQQRF